jgi:Flp pilus assembly protein TadB
VPIGPLNVQALFIDYRELLALTSDTRCGEGSSMKLAGLLMLVAGWLLIVATIALLGTAPLRGAFIAAGIAVEAIGLGLLVRSHLVLRGDHG